MKINYITNLRVAEASGGWSGMNREVWLQLRNHFDINLIEDINPVYSLASRLSSKFARVIGRKGIFPAFTASRLDKIAALVEGKIDRTASLNFFHGATPWLHVKQNLPYALYADACFASYIKVYHNSNEFSKQQLESLFEKEARFLERAHAVFFSSAWAMNAAKNEYGVTGKNFHVAGLGGGLGETETIKEPLPFFLFVANDFAGKGGVALVNAFKTINAQFPHYSLKMVGAPPPDDILSVKGVEYLGYINKSQPAGLERLRSLFATASCFVLPTGKDMTPLVLIEAGSAGCPVISINNFGIPEIVLNEQTGILLNPGGNMEEILVTAMQRICSDKQLRNRLGNAARVHIRNSFTWDKTGEIISREIFKSLN